MSTTVTLPEGVRSTLIVFGMMHNAFLSATPTVSITKSLELSVNKKRFLQDFKDFYNKAIDASVRLHEPNEVKAILKDPNGLFRQNGSKLLAFADTWRTYITKKSELPTKSEQKAISSELDLLSKIRFEIDDTQGRSKLVNELLKIKGRSRYSRFPALSGDSALQGILDRARSTNNRTSSMYELDLSSSSSTKTYKILDLTGDNIRDLISHAKEIVGGAVTRPLDPESATWHDFATVSETDMDSPELIGETFSDQRTLAVNLLKSVDLLYSQTMLGDSVMKFLASAATLAEKYATDAKNGRSQQHAENATLLTNYATALRTLSGEISAFKMAESAKIQSSFVLQFPLSMKNIDELGGKLGAAWGTPGLTIGSGWSKAATVAFKTGMTSAVNATGVAGLSGPGSVAGNTGGPLSRVIDPQRVSECVDLMSKFISSLGNSEQDAAIGLVTNTHMYVADITKKIQTLKAANPDDNGMAIDGLRDQQARVIRSFMVRARGLLIRHRDRHTMFALRNNRGPMKYMFYWRDCGDANLRSQTTDYTNKLTDAIAYGKTEIDAITSSVEGLMKDGTTFTGLTNQDVESIEEQFESIRVLRQSCKDSITAAHSRPTTFIDQLSTDTHVHVIYVLKLIRFGLAWMSLSIATKAFTSVYASNVYIKNVDPPSPSVFLAMFFGVDLALNAGLLTALWAASRMFKAPSNDFPIDGYLLNAWAVDLACSEGVMMAIAFAFGNIIATKKAFRYRQEGDRGIRALGQMMLYSYGVILFIPFFRVV